MSEKSRTCNLCHSRGKFRRDLRTLGLRLKAVVPEVFGINVGTEDVTACKTCSTQLSSYVAVAATTGQDFQSDSDAEQAVDLSGAHSLIMNNYERLTRVQRTQLARKVLSDNDLYASTELSGMLDGLQPEQKSAIVSGLAPSIKEEASDIIQNTGFKKRHFDDLYSATGDKYLNLVGPVSSALLSVSPNAKVHYKVKLIEALCKCVHARYISPIAFRETAVIHSITNSKISQLILSSSLACGSFETLRNFLKDQKSERISLPRRNDTITAFDNQQIVGRDHTVHAYSTQPVAKCTAVLHISYPLSSLQFSDDLADISESVIKSIRLMKDHTLLTLTADEENVAATNLKRLFAKSLDRVKNEISPGSAFKMQWFMTTANLVIEKMNKKVCISCGKPYEQKQRMCKDCDKDLPSMTDSRKNLEEQMDQLVADLPDCCNHAYHHPQFTSVPMIQPEKGEFLNDDPMFSLPNSKAGTREIVRKLGELLQLKHSGGDRNFAILACDGQPYSLLLQIIEKSVLCKRCGEAMDSDDFSKHNRECHASTAVSVSEFGWLVLQMGTGHFEMNYLRAAIDLFWNDFFEFAAKSMNFLTPTALSYAKSAKDTHKSYDFFVILRYSLIDELVYQYVENSRGPDFSFERFKTFVDKSPNPSLRNAFDFLAHVIEPLMLFRSGVRKNNSLFLTAGQKLCSRLFFARNSRNYQKISLHRLSQLRQLPEPISTWLQKNESIIREPTAQTAEGADFILEEENKKAKEFLAPTATEDDWLQTYRNIDKLNTMRTVTFDEVSQNDPKLQRSKKYRNMTKQVQKMRILYRHSNIFNPDNNEHLTPSGAAISKAVKNVLSDADNLLKTQFTLEQDSSVSSDDAYSENEL